MGDVFAVDHRLLTSWRQVVDAANYLSGRSWVFRGHDRADWILQTTLEREFGVSGPGIEGHLLWHFVRPWAPAPGCVPGEGMAERRVRA